MRLRLDVLGQRLDYVVATVKVGHGETGVLAAIPFADIRGPRESEEPEVPAPVAAFAAKSTDSVTLLSSSSIDSLWRDVEELIDRTLAAALKEFAAALG